MEDEVRTMLAEHFRHGATGDPLNSVVCHNCPDNGGLDQEWVLEGFRG